MATETRLHVKCVVCQRLVPMISELGCVALGDLIAVTSHLSECAKSVMNKLERAEDMVSFQNGKLEEVKKLSSEIPPVGYTFIMRGGKIIKPTWKNEHFHFPDISEETKNKAIMRKSDDDIYGGDESSMLETDIVGKVVARDIIRTK